MKYRNKGTSAILYESSETSSWADGLRGMYYKEFSVDELIINTTN